MSKKLIDEVDLNGVDYEFASSSENVSNGNGSVASKFAELDETNTSQNSRLTTLEGKQVDTLPLKMVVLGDSIGSDAQGIWRPFLAAKYGISIPNNLSVGKAGYAHRGGDGNSSSKAGTNYNLLTTDLTNEGASGKSNDNVITNQVNRLVYGISQGTIDEPDIVIIHAGINDRNGSDTTWGDDADTTMYGDVDELFKPLKASDETIPNTLTLNTDYKVDTEGYLRDMKNNNMTWAEAARLGIINAYDVRDNNNHSTIAIDSRLKSLAGGMRFAIETIWASYPAIKVIVTTPIYTQNTGYHKVRHINKVIKHVASYLSVPVIDLTYDAQINPWRYSWQSCDGLHPDVRGALYMAEAIGAGLVRHFGFVKPYNKYDRKLTINVTDSNGDPVAGYGVMLAFNNLWMSTFQDGYKIKSASGQHFPSETDANGQIVAYIPGWVYTVVHWNSTENKQYTLGTADLLTNEEVVINYTATDV